MTQTKKFSQFQGPVAITDTDIIVGLRNGDNYQFTGAGSGSGAAVKRNITQIGHGLDKGDYVRINAVGNYVKAQADSDANAELSGLVVDKIDNDNFTLQTVGYVEAGVFTGLTEGQVYFLSDVALGQHTLTDPSALGTVSLPVFWSETTETGYLRQTLGIINGGQPPVGSTSSTNPNIITITQNAHGFTVGQVLYIDAANHYAAAQANTLITASAVGIVIVSDPLTPNVFQLQTAGYVDGFITGMNPAAIYYLDPSNPGAMTTVRPTTVGHYIKQIYLTLDADTGYIQETQPIEILYPEENVLTITQAAHGFPVGTVLYVSAANTYARAIASALATASAVGVVIEADPLTPNVFKLQTSGYQSGLITGKTAAGVYYLDPAVLGGMTLTRPTAVSEYIKQIYIAESATSGYIQETQPVEIAAPAVGGSGWTLISSSTVAAPVAQVDVTGMTGYYRYKIVLENLIPTTDASKSNIRTSSDNGATFDSGASNYSYSAGSATYSDPYFGTKIVLDSTRSCSNVTANGGVSGFIEIINPSNVTKNKSLIFNAVSFTTSIFGSNGGAMGCDTIHGMRQSTAIINAIRFYFDKTGVVNNVTSGTIKIYGTNV